MNEQRPNAVIVSYVNQDVLDGLNIQQLAADFAMRSDIRKGILALSIKETMKYKQCFSSSHNLTL